MVVASGGGADCNTNTLRIYAFRCRRSLRGRTLEDWILRRLGRHAEVVSPAGVPMRAEVIDVGVP